MIFISAEKRHFAFYMSIGLLSIPLLAECIEVRLVGPSRCSGRLEIFHTDSWGTVCDDQWSLANADVVCREINCGTALQATKAASFGAGKNMIWLDDVQCTGHETSILKCPHREMGQNNCGHSEDAGVTCAEHVKIVNGSNRCTGRVEVYLEGNWKRACKSDWEELDAVVVCRELNCGTPVTQTEELYFGESRDLHGIKANCLGNESSISLCGIQKSKESCVDATIVCEHSTPIRLVNGSSDGRCSGRVEVFHDGNWGTICDDKWGMQEADVTCREMNCGNAISVKYKSFFGRGHNQVLLDDVECTGHEKSISECPHRGFGEHDCDHNEDAGVICSESLRLANGTDRCSGRVEVLANHHWGKICNNLASDDAAVVCKELGCGAPKKIQESFNFGDSTLRGYSSRCYGPVDSFSKCNIQDYTGRCEAVSLSCAGNPPLRLVNGTDQCSGRVEVLHDGMWGTVCDDEWDIKDAQVVCRAMDCGTAKTAKSGSFFGEGHGDIWLDDVRCVGNETSLLHCRHAPRGETNCGHAEDAGVVCSATIRLVNGTDQCSGRVEFFTGVKWATPYHVNWGINEAAVVCREMNCGDPDKLPGSYGHGGHPGGYQVSCNGRESSLSQCTLRERGRTSHDRIEEASVKCLGNVRLSNGSSHCAGRVEFYDKGQWGTVCGESWDVNDANVACRQLDCGTAHKITTLTEYGHSTGHTWSNRIECNGLESTLTQCSQSRFRDRTCNITSVAGVVCTGNLEVRLANGKDVCSGRVEVRHGDMWQTVCDTDWTLSKAQLVCEQLECGEAKTAPGSAHFGEGSGPVVEASNSCFDNVTSLQQCSAKGYRGASCGHGHDAGTVCAAQIRLVDGTGQCSGRLEVLYKGQWGTVCDDEWSLGNGDVVCRQLACGHAISVPTSAHFGRGTGPIWLDNVECAGEENAITHCPHNGFGQNNCGHGEDAGVICLGALQKPQITLIPAPEVNWGDKVEITCNIITEKLGGTFFLKRIQDSFQMEKFTENEAATFIFHSVDFNQKGSYFCEYQKKLPNQVIYFPQGETAELSIIVKLEKPILSLSSPHAMVVYSPDKISVTRGSSFSVTCSTHSIYPGGFFYLTKSHNNVTEPVPAFGYSIHYLTTFTFPEIDYENQGDYRCIYGVNMSSMSFSSVPSKSLQVSVVAASSSSVTTGWVVGLLLVLLVGVLGYLMWRKRRRVAGTMVQFSNRFGGALKEDLNDRCNGALYESARNTQENEQTHSPGQDENNAEVDNSVERIPEDLAGRVCYELEPLVFP
ncbi:deleted in malignant brain tumors 1 protein-like [Gymnodraco acuticeps]|uniref:Soluble scavenger receptor cysteine-rich domain-containing protein SSC5D n=1 Tax=Gymnodraco acuticeps TaxID=8218 RepID=A0A6P8TWD8_GYMAC|nr:deleted in malignant brain tumors 1 protein-like [Gymnodraco acuticeps]XP_034062820.1 deleted in malignant brain tumors 1 protein-like [Gymnodraco acuticeps]